MFSRAPFLNQNTEDFAYVKPMEIQEVELDKKLKSESLLFDRDSSTLTDCDRSDK